MFFDLCCEIGGVNILPVGDFQGVRNRLFIAYSNENMIELILGHVIIKYSLVNKAVCLGEFTFNTHFLKKPAFCGVEYRLSRPGMATAGICP